MRDEMPSGTVKYFNEAKGYGFIARDGGGNDLFCTHLELCRNLEVLTKDSAFAMMSGSASAASWKRTRWRYCKL